MQMKTQPSALLSSTRVKHGTCWETVVALHSRRRGKRILLQRSSSTVQCTDRRHLTSIRANSNRVVHRAIVELWLGSVPWAGHLCREVEQRALHSPRGIPDSTRRYSRQEDSRGAVFVCCNRE